jgi:signal transduction histidine kinase
VLDQLLENAVKYSPAGCLIEIDVRAEADAAVLTVSDCGRGILPEDLDRVFERFYRAGAGPSGPGGAGLGLWIVRRTVEAQGGQVTAAKRPEGGTVVTVRLPPT